jgi:hypothetical protein
MAYLSTDAILYLTKDDLTSSKRDLFLLFALSLPAGLLFFTCAATVVTRYHPAVKPTLLAEQWSYHLPYVESENVEMEDVHGNRFRLDFALAVSNGKWPFCTGGNPREGQISVPIEGARTALFCKRKINSVECLAMCYHNGTKGREMIPTTFPFDGVWDLQKPQPPVELPPISFNTPTSEVLYLRWLSSIMMFVACQGCSPWFEARVGHLTGTTSLKIP